MAEYTQFAMKAMSLADLFNMVFGKERITGSINYRAELSAPDGPSTAGGKQAWQHLKLIPEGGGTVIVWGSASRAENRAEMRTFAHLQQLHAQRYRGAEIPLNRVQYEELFRKVQRMFADQGITVEVLDAGGQQSPVVAPVEPPSTSRSLYIAFGVLIMLAVGGGVFLLLSSR